MVALVLLALGIFLLLRRWQASGFNADLFQATLSRARWDWLAIGSVFALLSYLGRAIRWRVMLEPLKPNPSLARLFSATAIGFTAVVLLGRPGELVRPWLIAQNEGVSFSSQLAAWLLERIYDLLLVLLIFGFALAWLGSSGVPISGTLRPVFQVGGWAIAVICLICLATLFALHRYSDTLAQRLSDSLAFLQQHHHEKISSRIASLVDGFRSTKSVRSIFLLILYSAIEWFTIVVSFHFVLGAFSETAHFGLAGTLVYLGFVAFGSIVQLPGIGGGMQLISTLVLVEVFGLTLESAAGISLVSWIVGFITIVPFGIVLALREHLSFRRFLKIGEESN